MPAQSSSVRVPSGQRSVASTATFIPHFITIRRDEAGYGIRYGLTEAEDALRHGPSFDSLPEALAWIDALDRERTGLAA